MRRATPTLPVSPAMLRHFAVLTVAITCCIGVFASGENREYVQQQVKAHSSKSAEAQAQSGQSANPKMMNGIAIAPGTMTGGRTGEYDDRGGQAEGGGEAVSGSGTGDIANYEGPPIGSGPMPGSPIGPYGPKSGITPQGPSSQASPGSRGGPAGNRPTHRPTAQEIDRMMAAARERSGKASED